MMICRYIFLFILVLGSVGFAAEPGRFSAGLKFQKTLNLYYENGLELGYTHDGLWKQRIQFQISYISSRFGSAMGSNALVQDYYQASTGLHFRPEKLFDPFLQINMGYFRYDVENKMFDFLDNQSMIFSLVSGIKFNLIPRVGGVYADLGINLVQDANTLYPLFFNIGLVFNVFPGILK
jgi:hypothetical protein